MRFKVKPVPRVFKSLSPVVQALVEQAALSRCHQIGVRLVAAKSCRDMLMGGIFD